MVNSSVRVTPYDYASILDLLVQLAVLV